MNFIEYAKAQLQEKAITIAIGALSALTLLVVKALTPDVLPIL